MKPIVGVPRGAGRDGKWYRFQSVMGSSVGLEAFLGIVESIELGNDVVDDEVDLERSFLVGVGWRSSSSRFVLEALRRDLVDLDIALSFVGESSTG